MILLEASIDFQCKNYEKHMNTCTKSMFSLKTIVLCGFLYVFHTFSNEIQRQPLAKSMFLLKAFFLLFFCLGVSPHWNLEVFMGRSRRNPKTGHGKLSVHVCRMNVVICFPMLLYIQVGSNGWERNEDTNCWEVRDNGHEIQYPHVCDLPRARQIFSKKSAETCGCVVCVHGVSETTDYVGRGARQIF